MPRRLAMVPCTPAARGNFRACGTGGWVDTVKAAFDLIVSEIRDHNAELGQHITVTHLDGKLSVARTGEAAVDLADSAVFSCYLDHLPEMLCLYIIAQLLKIFEAEPANASGAIRQARLEILHKMCRGMDIADFVKPLSRGAAAAA